MAEDYGFLIRNSYGNLVIDSDFINYTVSSNQSKSLTTGVNYITFTSTSNPPLLIIKPSTTCYCCWYSYLMSGSNFYAFGIISSGSGTINYRLVYPSVPTSFSGNYGIAVCNSSGTLIFSSETTHPKVIQVYNPSMPSSPSSAETTLTVNNTTNYYYLMTPLKGGAVVTYRDRISTNYICAFKKKSTTSIGFKQIPLLSFYNAQFFIGDMETGGRASSPFSTFLELGGNF